MGAPSHMGPEILSGGYLNFHLLRLCRTTPALQLLHAQLIIYSPVPCHTTRLSLVLFATPDSSIYVLFGGRGNNSLPHAAGGARGVVQQEGRAWARQDQVS